jgi:hypothetical protein
MICGRYCLTDETVDVSYTEKEYNYAKRKGMPVLVLIKDPAYITEEKRDKGNEKHDKYEMMRRLDSFREKVKNDRNTVDSFTDMDNLKYVAAASLRNAIDFAGENSGWVRYSDVIEVINEEAEGRYKVSATLGDQQNILLDELKNLLVGFENRLSDIEKMQLRWEEIPTAANEDIEKLFQVEGETLVIGNSGNNNNMLVVGKDDVGNIPVDSAFLLVYAAADNGQILKIQPLGSPVQIYTASKQFMAELSQRESARWAEALDRLICWGWVKPVGYKGQIFELTGTGYQKADWLKECMKINTDNEPLDELKEFEYYN